MPAVTSNLECVGLDLERDAFEALVGRALSDAELLGEADGVAVRRWTDPSGARMTIGTRGREVVGFVPSYAGAPGAVLRGVRAVNDDVIVADVLDDDGEQVTMLAAALEEAYLLAAPGATADGRAGIVALGVDVAVHADEEAFAASDASLLSDPGEDPGDPPPHVVEHGWPWPPRMGTESFISYGVFGDPDNAEAYARLHGTVLSASRRTVVATGRQFTAARVRTAGFEADLCLPAGLPSPVPGNVVGGTVYLVASRPMVAAHTAVLTGKPRRWWRR